MRNSTLFRALHSSRLACALLLVSHFAMSAVFAGALPALESFDEPAHYAYVRYIAVNGELPPRQGIGHEPYEMHQPPLYYLLVALGVAGIDVSDDLQSQFLWGVHVAVKPDTRLNDIASSGTALAIRVGRLISALLSTIAVWFTYLSMKRLLPRRMDVVLLATGLHAMWPMSVFMGGVISNDNGISLAGSLTLLAVSRLLFGLSGSTWRSRLFDYVGLALALGVAVLMKDTAISLLLFSVLALAVLVIRSFRIRQPSEFALIVVSVALTLGLLVAGWVWSDGRSMRQFNLTAGFASNLATQALDTSDSVVSVAETSIVGQARALLDNAGWVFATFVGVFGRGSLSLPVGWYRVAALIVFVCGLGVLVALAKGRYRSQIAFLVLFVVCVTAAPLVRVLVTGNAGLMHGRFVLPAFGALAMLLSIGIAALPGRMRRPLGVVALSGAMFVSLVTPTLVIQPLFQKSPIYFAPAAEFVAPNGISIRYGDDFELLGYELYTPRAARGGSMSVLLYWRALRPLQKNYRLKLEGFSLTGRSFGSFVESEPALDTFPTTQWKPDEVYREGYYLLIWDHVDVPTVGTFKVSWIDPDSGTALPAYCDEDTPCDPKIGAVPITMEPGATATWRNHAPCCRLGDRIDLIDSSLPSMVTADQSIPVSLVWRSLAGGLPPLKTFIHVVSEQGQLVAQVDALPRAGEYPTQFWGANDVIPDEYRLQLPHDLPPGNYNVVAGLYDPQTLERVLASDRAGVPFKDNVIPLQSIQVRAPSK